MSKLLIIDVQNTYIEFILGNDLLGKIEKLAEDYSGIYYLWDNISGQDLYDEIPEDWINPSEFNEDGLEIEQESFYDRFNKIIEKQYGFMRSIMDANHNKDDIVKLGKFMLKNNMVDAREIFECNDDIFNLFKKEFKNSSLLTEDFYGNVFSIPVDLIEELNHLSGCVLVGGGRNECLEEISLLMKIANIEHSILEEYCY